MNWTALKSRIEATSPNGGPRALRAVAEGCHGFLNTKAVEPMKQALMSEGYRASSRSATWGPRGAPSRRATTGWSRRPRCRWRGPAAVARCCRRRRPPTRTCLGTALPTTRGACVSRTCTCSLVRFKIHLCILVIVQFKYRPLTNGM